MTGLLDLPFDVLSMIFRELPVVDIILIRLTCKRLLEATQERSVWAYAIRDVRRTLPSAVRRSALPLVQHMSSKDLQNECLHAIALNEKWRGTSTKPRSTETYSCTRDTERVYLIPVGEGSSQWYFSLTTRGALRLATLDGKKKGVVKEPMYKTATAASLVLFTTSNYESLIKWETRYTTSDDISMITTTIYRYWFDDKEKPHIESLRKLSFGAEPEDPFYGVWPAGDIVAVPWKMGRRMIISIYIIDHERLSPPPEALNGPIPTGRLIPDDQIRPESVLDDTISSALHIGPEWNLENAILLALSWTEILIVNPRGMMIFPIPTFQRKPKVSREATRPLWRHKCDLGGGFTVSKVFWALEPGGKTQRHLRPLIITVAGVGVYVLKLSYPNLGSSSVHFVKESTPKPLLREGIRRAMWLGLKDTFVLGTFPGNERGILDGQPTDSMTLGKMQSVKSLFDVERDIDFDEQSGRMLVLLDGVLGKKVLVVNLV